VPWRRRAAREPILTPGQTLTALYAAAGMAPDLDLLVGSHSTYTHSLGATILVFAVTLFAARRCLPVHAVTASWRSPRFAAAVAAAWASHLLLDWLGSDTSAPIGIMALWPFTRDHYQSSLQVFGAISRRYWLPEQFIWGNLRAAAREVLILAPLVGFSYWVTSARHGGTEDTETTRSS
jgi:inner membrane protein